MSCASWRAFAAARALAPDVEPPDDAGSRRHLDDCPDCRRAALAVEPLLLFSALRPASSGPSVPDREMESSVLALVRAARVAGSALEAPSRRRSTATRAAATLLFASLLALGGAPRSPESARDGGALVASAAELERFLEEASGFDQPPPIEDLERPEARIYDLSHADIAVVMIVDASLDV